jgi:SAM-dependent methyltransferase
MSHMPGFDELYSVRDLPVFQNLMFDSQSEARSCVRGDVDLVRDLRTGLIYNRSFRPELMQYDANYQNEQAVSAVFRQHLENVAGIVEKYFSGSSLIEVGCGKGHFLELLRRRGFTITGMDPTYEGTDTSILKEYFSKEIGLRADAIVLRHVLEHVGDPVGFLSNLCEANGGGGKIYIEVPCFDWICHQKAWFDVFYEHVNYFRLSDFHRMFGVVLDAGHVFAGQYLYVVAELSRLRDPAKLPLDPFVFPKNFLSTVRGNAEKMKSRSSVGNAIWGGASKGVTFALFMERAEANVDVVVDVNPAKHGKYLPGTGLKVHSPNQAMSVLPPGANIVVMNGNYLHEIRALTANQFKYLTVDHDGS